MPTRSGEPHKATGAGLPAAALHRDVLLDAMVAGCAVIVHADGEAVPAERDKALLLVCGHPLLSAYPADAVLRAFKAHERAFLQDAPAARVAALRQVEPLAREPGWARQVLNACLTLTGADGGMQSREITAIKQVRDALGLSPDRRRARSRVAVLAALLLAGPAVPGPALAGASQIHAPYHGHDPELRRLAHSAVAENQAQLARPSRWQARHGEKHVQ